MAIKFLKTSNKSLSMTAEDIIKDNLITLLFFHTSTIKNTNNLITGYKLFKSTKLTTEIYILSKKLQNLATRFIILSTDDTTYTIFTLTSKSAHNNNSKGIIKIRIFQGKFYIVFKIIRVALYSISLYNTIVWGLISIKIKLIPRGRRGRGHITRDRSYNVV